jgi:hypothetical protein
MYNNIKTFINYPCILVIITFFIGSPYAYAQSENTKEAVLEQNISASSVDDERSSRNPFQPYAPFDEEPVEGEMYGAGGGGAGELSQDDQENRFDYSSLRVTGSVWGNDMPKAIINDQVMGIGDIVNEAKILNITKDGILFEFKDKRYLMKRQGTSGK